MFPRCGVLAFASSRRGSFFLPRQKESKKALFINGWLGHLPQRSPQRIRASSGDLIRCANSAHVPALRFCLVRVCYLAFVVWALAATSDTVRTHLFGRSDSLREFCSRARVAVLLSASLRPRFRNNEQHGAVLFQINSLFQKSEQRRAFDDVKDFC